MTRRLELKRRGPFDRVEVYSMPREDIGAIYRDRYPEPGTVYCVQRWGASKPMTFTYTQDYSEALRLFHL